MNEHNPNSRAYSINCGVSSPRGARTHMTLMYLGQQSAEKMDSIYIGEMYNCLAQELEWPIFTKFIGTDKFGENNDIPVLLLDTPKELILAREIVRMFITDWKIKPKTNFDLFRPHITIKEPELDFTIHATAGTNIFFPQLISWEI